MGYAYFRFFNCFLTEGTECRKGKRVWGEEVEVGICIPIEVGADVGLLCARELLRRGMGRS